MILVISLTSQNILRWAATLNLSSLGCKDSRTGAWQQTVLHLHLPVAQMLVGCQSWLDPGLGLIKLANPAVGMAFQGQGWGGHKLEVSRTLLGGALAWHNSDGKWFVGFREGAEWVGRSCTRGRWNMKLLHWRCGSAADAADEWPVLRNRRLLATSPISLCQMLGERSIWDEQLSASCQLIHQGDLKLVWQGSQGSSCESHRMF